MDAYNSYLEVFLSGRDVLIDALKRRFDLPPEEGNKLVQETEELITKMQRRTEPLAAGLRSSVTSITSLLAWAVFSGLSACWRFKRYDVR
jgi:hypothetical protein